jgi:transcriptional regulator with XRE-family HTH domain
VITNIREVRRAKRMTLADVAAACKPPTTAQTIGRLETGTRTVSVGWLNRIAAALRVEAADLVRLPEQAELPVVAELALGGAFAPRHSARVIPPRVDPSMVAVRVTESIGDYRAGDELWCERLAAEAFGQALNRDIVAPKPAGRFVFGRLIGREGERLLLLPPGAGSRQVVLSDPPWIAVVRRLVRPL